MCLIAYMVAVIHEMGHLLASKILGYSADGVKIEPFGVCLKLSSRISNSVHEFVISMAGPFVNFIMLALGTALTYSGIYIPKAFFIANFYMLFINLLPVMPLDGGRIVKSVLKAEMGEKKAQKIITYISVPVVCSIAVFGVILLFKSKLNASLLIASLFMCNNIKISNNKPMDIVSLYDTKIVCDRTKVFCVNYNLTVREVIKMLPFEEIVVVYVASDEGKILKTITNKYILGISNSNYLNLKISDI